jgi:hypothetical protein
MKKILTLIMALLLPINVFAQTNIAINSKYKTELTTYYPEGVPANPTVFDVVAAAQNWGVNSLNIQSLSNFLIVDL